jgi:hypothetical protein
VLLFYASVVPEQAILPRTQLQAEVSKAEISMGREAICTCTCGDETFEVKAMLDTNELILRGGIAQRIPFAAIQSAVAVHDALSLHVDGEAIELMLGQAVAERWVAAIRTPPSLAKKLGINGLTVVRTIGMIRDEDLKNAIAEASRVSATDCNLIIACVDTPESLNVALLQASTQMFTGVPIWIVYPKGPGLPLSEDTIRSLMRSAGMMDTKIASVSTKLTSRRFNLKK